MLSSWCFKFFAIILKLCGLQTFNFPAKKFKSSKLGLFLYLLNLLCFLYICTDFLLVLIKLHLKVDNLLKTLSLLMSLSLISTRILILIVNFLARKKMFNLFQNLDELERMLHQICIPLIYNKNVYWSVIILIAKLLGFFYILGTTNAIFVAMYMTIYLPVDFYFLIVLMINNQIELILKHLRYDIFFICFL